MATTDFEPVDARRAFPCFDEPAIKANYSFTMIRHKSFTSSLFNTPIVETVAIDSEWLMDHFKPTVKMSTYLVAFVVSNFENVTKVSEKGVEINIVARPQAIAAGDGDFALEETAEIMDFFADYFDIDYPLDKSSK